jgi:hypothetical protein
MTTLAQRQADFMRAILDEGAPLPTGWSNRHAIGISVYRGNYRSALMAALASTYERTLRYVGEGPFRRVAAHHVITHPPAGWSIEDAGAGFDATCEQLFGNNPEVAELAWLEWSMVQVGTAPDTVPLDPAAFGSASAGFGDAEWLGLTLTFQPRAAALVVEHDLPALWQGLEADADVDLPVEPRLQEPRGCLVWREDERPTFMLVEPDTAHAFAAMQAGATYGALVELLAGEAADEAAFHEAAMRAGAMLGLWLSEGIVTGFEP